MSLFRTRRARGRAQNSASNQVRSAIESLEFRRLLAAVAWDGGGDGVNWFDGANWSTNAVPTGADDVTINVVANPNIQLDRPTTIRSLVNAESLTILGNGTFGVAQLSINQGGSNSGTLTLDGISVAAGRLSVLNGAFDNTGTIRSQGTGANQIDVSTSGSAPVSLTNNGTIDVVTGAVLTIDGQADDSFIQQGSITVAGGTRLTVSDLSLIYNGGSNTDGVYMHSGSIDINAASSASTIIAYGTNTLIGHDAANLTLRVQGEGQQFGPAILNTAAVGASNSGIIELDGLNSTESRIAILGGTFTNTGTIRALASTNKLIQISNSSVIAATFQNSGTVEVQAGGRLNVTGQLPDTFNQQGTITVGGAGARFNVSGITFNYNGGSNTSGVYVDSSSIDINAAAAASSMIAIGTNTLLGHDAANITLIVQGENQQFGPAVLNTVATGVVNNGTIELDSLNATTSRISILGGTFTNAGTIRVNAGGDRQIQVSVSTAVAATFVNNGTITVGDGATPTISGQVADSFHQNGTITIGAAAARLTVTGLSFRYVGGSNTNGMYINGSTLDLDAASSASTLIANGTNTLFGHDAANLTLVVQGENQLFGTAVLQVESDGIVNNSTIVLDGLNGVASRLRIDTGTFTNGAAGRITATAGGERLIQVSTSTANAATFASSGTLEVLDGAALRIAGQIPDQFIQSGTITVGGLAARLSVSGVTFRYTGGTNTAGLYVDSGTIDLDAAAAPATVIAQGTNTLIGHDAANITLVAQGETQLFGVATLTSAPNTTNNGLILLDGISGQTSRINVPADSTFTNGVNGLIRLMLTGSAPSILVSNTDAAFINNGIIRFTGDVDLGGGGVITNQARIEKPDGGESEFGPRLFNTTNGVVDVAAGTLRVTGDSNVDEGTFLSGGRYTVANGAALRFGFSGGPTVLTADIDLHGTAQADLGQLRFNRGRIALEDGADLTIAPNNNLFTHEGIIDLSPTSELTINANFAHAGTSQPIIRTEIASLTDFGKVTINGSANLNSPDSSSRLDPDLVAPFDPALGTQFPVFTATGGITNAFDGFLGGLTPSSNILKLVRPNAQTAAVEIAPGPLPPPPMILSTSYEFETREALTFQFDQDVSAFLGRKDYRLENLTTGQTIAQSAGTLSYNQTSNQATLTLTNQVPDGNYLLTIQASDISNGAGVPATNGITFPFFIFRGDANRDRAINISDFAILASRFNQPGTFSQGDFNYDGTTNINDFAILAAKFNSNLPAASPRVTAFSQTPLHKTASWQRDDVEDLLSN